MLDFAAGLKRETWRTANAGTGGILLVFSQLGGFVVEIEKVTLGIAGFAETKLKTYQSVVKPYHAVGA